MSKSVSVIIPTFNRAHLLGVTIDSVIYQTFENWECIVIDDGSSDYTEELMSFYCSKDHRIKFYKRPITRNKGASTCRNIGFENSKLNYVQYLDADDLISKDKLKAQLQLLESCDKLSIATCKWGRFDKQYEIYENLESYSNFEEISGFLNSLIFSKGYFPLNAYLIPRDLIQISGFWNENLTINDDGEFVMRILTHCNKVLFEPNSVGWYRTATGNNLSSFKKRNAVEKAIYSWQLIEAHLKIKYKDQTNEFIDWSKERFYINVKNSHPELLKAHFNFFSKEIKKDKNNQKLFFRIKSKINRILR